MRSQFNYRPRGSKGGYSAQIHERVWLTFCEGVLCIPEHCCLKLFLLIMSFFSRLIFCRSLHTQRPTVARSLFMSLRDTEAKHKELSTEGRGPWAQRWPLKDVCGLHPVAAALPLQAPGSSLFCRWPFAKLPKHVQTGLRLSMATGSPNDWFLTGSRLNPVLR